MTKVSERQLPTTSTGWWKNADSLLSHPVLVSFRLQTRRQLACHALAEIIPRSHRCAL